MRLIFWWNLLSPHQSAYVRELANYHTVIVVANQTMSKQRQDSGWNIPDLGNAQVLISPSIDSIIQMVTDITPTLHLLEGLRGYKYARIIFKTHSTRHRIAIITETYDSKGFSGLARQIRSLIDSYQVRKDLDFVLAIGSAAVSWHRRFNFAGGRIFPFCYVAEYPNCPNSLAIASASNNFRIIYVGRLIKCKAIQLLIKALSLCNTSEWTLDIVGSGEEKDKISHLAQNLKIDRNIKFHGLVNHNGISNHIRNSDLLILPSILDGWGVVVNESLMMGVPVICSSTCGAADLLKDSRLGSVFESGSVKSLSRNINKWIAKGSVTDEERNYIKLRARQFDGPSIARYFMAVYKHMYENGAIPLPPWI